MTRAVKVMIAVAAIFTVALCGTGFYVVSSRVDFFRRSSHLEEAVALAEKAGVPMSVEDLDLRPMPSANTNAAPILKEASEAYDALGGTTFDQHLLAARSNGDRVRTRELVSRAENLLDLAKEASEKPNCDFEREWELGVFVLFPEYAPVKSICRILSARAELRAESGQHRGASQDLAAILKLADHIHADRTVLSLLVRLACEAIALDSANRCASLAKEGELDPYLALLGRAPRLDYYQVLRIEAYMEIASLRNMDVIGDKSIPDDAKVSRLRRTGFPKDFISRSLAERELEFWTRVFENVPRGEESGELIAAALKRESQRMDSLRGLSSQLASSLFLYQDGKAFLTSERSSKARRRCLKALLLMRNYIAKTGRAPTALAQLGLAADEQIDPYSKGQLKFIVKGTEVRVWSVGDDLNDDGGQTKVKVGREMTMRRGDIAAQYPPAPRPPLTAPLPPLPGDEAVGRKS